MHAYIQVCDELVRVKSRQAERQAKERSLFLKQLSEAHMRLSEAEASATMDKNVYRQKLDGARQMCAHAEAKIAAMSEQIRYVYVCMYVNMLWRTVCVHKCWGQDCGRGWAD